MTDKPKTPWWQVPYFYVAGKPVPMVYDVTRKAFVVPK